MNWIRSLRLWCLGRFDAFSADLASKSCVTVQVTAQGGRAKKVARAATERDRIESPGSRTRPTFTLVGPGRATERETGHATPAVHPPSVDARRGDPRRRPLVAAAGVRRPGVSPRRPRGP